MPEDGGAPLPPAWRPAVPSPLRGDYSSHRPDGEVRLSGQLGAERESAAIAEQYADLGIGLADASLVALARRLETVEIATFDERHFRAIQPMHGGRAFRLLPLDAG